jgi:tetraacyldisaccharide-1-P 4'-kinase
LIGISTESRRLPESSHNTCLQARSLFSLLTFVTKFTILLRKELTQKSPFSGFCVFLTRMVIAVASQNGGTGKTSTSISLAAGLVRTGKNVLLIEIDSQGNSSKVLLPEYPKILKEQTIYTTIIKC